MRVGDDRNRRFGAIIVALDFDQVCPALLEGVDVLVTLGSTARELAEQFAKRMQRRSPEFAERPGLEHSGSTQVQLGPVFLICEEPCLKRRWNLLPG